MDHRNEPQKYLLMWDNFEGHTVQDPKLILSVLLEEYKKEVVAEGKRTGRAGFVLKEYEEQMRRRVNPSTMTRPYVKSICAYNLLYR